MEFSSYVPFYLGSAATWRIGGDSLKERGVSALLSCHCLFHFREDTSVLLPHECSYEQQGDRFEASAFSSKNNSMYWQNFLIAIWFWVSERFCRSLDWKCILGGISLKKFRSRSPYDILTHFYHCTLFSSSPHCPLCSLGPSCRSVSLPLFPSLPPFTCLPTFSFGHNYFNVTYIFKSKFCIWEKICNIYRSESYFIYFIHFFTYTLFTFIYFFAVLPIFLQCHHFIVFYSWINLHRIYMLHFVHLLTDI